MRCSPAHIIFWLSKISWGFLWSIHFLVSTGCFLTQYSHQQWSIYQWIFHFGCGWTLWIIISHDTLIHVLSTWFEWSTALESRNNTQPKKIWPRTPKKFWLSRGKKSWRCILPIFGSEISPVGFSSPVLCSYVTVSWSWTCAFFIIFVYKILIPV